MLARERLTFTVQAVPDETREPRVRPWLAKLLYVVVIGGAILLVGPRLVSWHELAKSLTGVTWWQYLALVGLMLVGLYPKWVAQQKLLPGLKLKQAAWADICATGAANGLPAGGPISLAVYWAMWRHWVKDDESIAASLTTLSILGTLARLSMPLLAVIGLVIAGEPLDGIGKVAEVAAGFFALLVLLLIMLMKSEALPRVAAKAVKTPVAWAWAKMHKPVPDVEKELNSVREHMQEDGKRAWKVFALLLAQQLWQLVLLAACLYIVGVSMPPVTQLFAAFVVGRIAGTVQVTPGGAGIAELGLTAALAMRLSDTSHETVLAAVLLYRMATWAAPIILGGLSWIAWRITLRYQKHNTTSTTKTGARAPKAAKPNRQTGEQVVETT